MTHGFCSFYNLFLYYISLKSQHLKTSSFMFTNILIMIISFIHILSNKLFNIIKKKNK